jgi:uncharacterized membrane protein YdfJ with MMPL/SSD domain
VPQIAWEAWMIIGGVALAMLLAMLHVLASAVRVEKHLHDTSGNAASLRRAYAEQLAEFHAQAQRDNLVEIVGQGPRQAA